MNVAEMHRLVNVNMVDKRRTKCLLTVIHRGVQDKKYNMLDHGVNTRFNDGKKINLIKPRNETVRKSCMYTGTSMWNTLTLDFRNSSIKDFKNNLSNDIKILVCTAPFKRSLDCPRQNPLCKIIC